MQYFGFDRPSFGIKTFGFGERSPKLQADFTTGTYKQDGITKTFADLFNFTRAGKAWLVKESGLQEYAADIPRFDGGLLIEQSATNYLTWSVLQGTDVQNYPSSSSIIASDDTILKNGNMYTYTKGFSSRAYKTYSSSILNVDIYTSRTDKQEVVLGGASSAFSGYFYGVDTTAIKSKYNPTTGLTIVSAPCAGEVRSLGVVKYASQELPDVDLRSHAMQATEDDYSSSLIVTTTVPVTRPADFLANKITGTTITGDWDSTLNLSIVAGNLVHSGYGKIRSLEIN